MPQPRLLHQAWRRSLEQEGRGGEVHFHAAYAPIASEVVYVAAPGALVPDWSLLPYTKVDRTQWPFVADPHAA